MNFLMRRNTVTSPADPLLTQRVAPSAPQGAVTAQASDTAELAKKKKKKKKKKSARSFTKSVVGRADLGRQRSATISVGAPQNFQRVPMDVALAREKERLEAMELKQLSQSAKKTPRGKKNKVPLKKGKSSMTIGLPELTKKPAFRVRSGTARLSGSPLDTQLALEFYVGTQRHLLRAMEFVDVRRMRASASFLRQSARSATNAAWWRAGKVLGHAVANCEEALFHIVFVTSELISVPANLCVSSGGRGIAQVEFAKLFERYELVPLFAQFGLIVQPEALHKLSAARRHSAKSVTSDYSPSLMSISDSTSDAGDVNDMQRRASDQIVRRIQSISGSGERGASTASSSSATGAANVTSMSVSDFYDQRDEQTATECARGVTSPSLSSDGDDQAVNWSQLPLSMAERMFQPRVGHWIVGTFDISPLPQDAERPGNSNGDESGSGDLPQRRSVTPAPGPSCPDSVMHGAAQEEQNSLRAASASPRVFSRARNLTSGRITWSPAKIAAKSKSDNDGCVDTSDSDTIEDCEFHDNDIDDDTTLVDERSDCSSPAIEAVRARLHGKDLRAMERVFADDLYALPNSSSGEFTVYDFVPGSYGRRSMALTCRVRLRREVSTKTGASFSLDIVGAAVTVFDTSPIASTLSIFSERLANTANC